MLQGKKTYIVAITGAVSALALYVQAVALNGFDLTEFIKFVNSEALMLAFATLRQAVSKK